MEKRRLLPLAFVLLPAACVGGFNAETDRSGPAPDRSNSTPAGGDPAPSGPTNQPVAAPVNAPYEALSPRAYATKVKDLLTGLPLTDDELRAVTADGKALRGLIDAWMATPQFRSKMLEFFKSAFQQTQLTPPDLNEQIGLTEGGISGADQRRMLRAVEEMFARTALAIVEGGRPFTETVTTTRFMMNVPLMMAFAYMDATPKDDANRAVAAGYWLLKKYGEKTFKYTQVASTDPVTGATVTIPLAESIDPAHVNFMKFTFQQPDPLRYMPCKTEISSTGPNAITQIYRALFGGRQGCQGAPAEPSVFADADWNDWRMVEIRPPKAGEERTVFWELNKLRDPKTTELVLGTARVGFFTTPAFLANWPTNASNSYRVTTNQALIVALGRSFDDRGTTVQVMETSDDSLHVQPGSPCYGCHQVLDPMRDFFKQSYSLVYREQLSSLDPKRPPLPAEGVFAIDSSVAPVRGAGVHALAQGMAQHPEFAPAWVQKLCQLANADTCLRDDPEFVRVAEAFARSKFDFKTLLRELMSSPLVTFAEKTKTAETRGVIMSIARRETLCDRLSNRLGVKDVCNIAGESGLPRIAGRVKNLSLGVPGSAYTRADELPVTPHDPNLFFVSGVEKICGTLSEQVVEAGATSVWKVANKDAALGDFVATLMGVPPSDSLHAQLVDVLARHHQSVVAAKQTPAIALRSAFVVACSSPLATSLGL